MNLAEFHFIRPYWLFVLIPAITLIIFLLRNKLNQGNWSQVCDPELLPFILQEKPVNRSYWRLSASALASLLAIIALAGPTWERLPTPTFRNDAALVIALDLSKSMDANDIKPSRLSLARYKIVDILKQRKDGQSALIVYAGSAFTVTPLTEDTETIINQVSALKTDIMPSQGSHTALALERSVELLKQAGLQQGSILLMTDEINFDQAMSAVKAFKGYDLSILGVGTPEGAPIKLAKGGFLKDKQGNIVVAKLNEPELSRLASAGQGIYRRMSRDDSDINDLINQFDHPMEKEQRANNNLLIEQWDEQGAWLLLLILPLVAFNFRKGILSLALLCLLPFPETSYALEWNDLWQTKNQQAQQAFQQKNYQQAAEQFKNRQWQAAAHYKSEQYPQAAELLKNEASAEGLYNLGNALAKSGKLAEAKSAYEKSLQIDPGNKDAEYNKEQVEKQLQKQEQSSGDDNKDSESDESKGQENKDKQKGDSEKSAEPEKSEDGEEAESEPSFEQNKDEQPEPKDAPSSEEQESDAKKEKEPPPKPEQSEYDETEQANEQWLNSIPDDPAGLLKRKFKYQYSRQKGQQTSDHAW